MANMTMLLDFDFNAEVYTATCQHEHAICTDIPIRFAEKIDSIPSDDWWYMIRDWFDEHVRCACCEGG